MSDYSSFGRLDLLRLIDTLEKKNAKLSSDHQTMLENLTATQKRCTELLNETRALKEKLARVANTLGNVVSP